MKQIDKFKSFINSGSARSQNIKKNAIGSVIIKMFAIFIDFAKVPILLSYLDSEHYGLFITISSIVMWTQNFDFGLGTGLRYKLTRSISQGNTSYAKKLVSTAYVSLFIIMGSIFLITIPMIASFDWNSILNSTVVDNRELILSIFIVLFAFIMQFVLELISYVLQSYQRAAISTIFKPLANLVTLLVIIFLKLFTSNSLLLASISMSFPFVVVLLFVNIYMYRSKYKSIAPSLLAYSKDCLKDIYSLGLKYFVGQLSTMVVFQTASILISHYVNPTEAAVYNTAFTYFALVTIINTMMLQPLTAAVTDAYVKDDYDWLKGCMKKINKVTVILTGVSIILLVASPIVFKFWVGQKLIIPFYLSCILTFYFILNIWTNPICSFLSGVGKMNVTMVLGAIKLILYIPVAIIMVKLLGTIGVVLSIIFVNTLPNNIIYTIQYNKIVNKTATGIWNK